MKSSGHIRPHRILHVMLRVKDLEASLAFYTRILGMRLLRRENFPEGCFTLAFIGYGSEDSNAVIELTHNWDTRDYEKGEAFGHIALAVDDLEEVYRALVSQGAGVLRPPGSMTFMTSDCKAPENIAFISDPEGYSIELIERT